MAHSCKLYIVCAVILCILCVSTPVVAIQTQDLEPIALDFSVHEMQTGPNATLLLIAGTGGMGTMSVFDNVVHEGENPDSKLLGRATGSGTATTMEGLGGGLQIRTQVSFAGGSLYNGSTITFMGTVLTPVAPWEVIVIGGTGYFRGIRGYAYVESGAAFPPIITYKWSVCGWV